MDSNCIDCLDNETCIECAEGTIVNADMTGCENEIDLCQDKPEKYIVDEETGRYRCLNCRSPFTWDFSTEGNNAWQCNRCEAVYENCAIC